MPTHTPSKLIEAIAANSSHSRLGRSECIELYRLSEQRT
ncbi:hypothetical protein AVDCRST_MAG92-2216 [uncultured Coleofasciculus sp.]|uniref:Uncharacterized protein n=1 Tax=uncultured Coleofasciculus sp. TaxID=1267456 RepID=A0A6J4IL35_9CYAN|nr:hypothetical protein AVDCRST_MAG92-2216 [uncultured Coleofasciculus sp.]